MCPAYLFDQIGIESTAEYLKNRASATDMDSMTTTPPSANQETPPSTRLITAPSAYNGVNKSKDCCSG